jgi:hypothetical protein
MQFICALDNTHTLITKNPNPIEGRGIPSNNILRTLSAVGLRHYKESGDGVIRTRGQGLMRWIFPFFGDRP